MRRLTVALVLLLTPIMLAANRVHSSDVNTIQVELNSAITSLDNEIRKTALTKIILVKSDPYYQCLSSYEDELSSLKSSISQNLHTYDFMSAHKLNQTFSNVRSSC